MLRERDLGDDALGRFTRLIAEAESVDGQPPFSDQSIVDARSGRRRFFELTAAGDGIVGAAIDSADDPAEFEFVIAPTQRRKGHGTVALGELLARHGDAVVTWAHGDHPGAAALAASFDLTAVRTLYQLRMPLGESSDERDGFDRFVADRDAAALVELNARVFVEHPEQGRMTIADLDARRAQPWFRDEDLLLARDDDGRLIGYNWLKVEDGIGEIYVLGVDASASGRGLGRRLMEAGLEQLRRRGCTTAALYVDDANARALALYRSMGFHDHTVDVQYRRAR